MIARVLLLFAVLAGLLGGQLDARGVCSVRAKVCAGCCAGTSGASCCQTNETPAPVNAPTANTTLDWKMVLQPVVAVLPKCFGDEKERPLVVPGETPRAQRLTRIELTCARLI